MKKKIYIKESGLLDFITDTLGDAIPQLAATVDGPDLLIAQQLMKLHIPLSLRNFVKYRQDVLRWHTMGDSHVFRVNEGVDR